MIVGYYFIMGYMLQNFLVYCGMWTQLGWTILWAWLSDFLRKFDMGSTETALWYRKPFPLSLPWKCFCRPIIVALGVLRQNSPIFKFHSWLTAYHHWIKDTWLANLWYDNLLFDFHTWVVYFLHFSSMMSSHFELWGIILSMSALSHEYYLFTNLVC